MQLYTWPTSPFGAKVWAVALATGLDTQIEKVLYHPWQPDAKLSRLNPLNKIPVLITPENEPLYDSPVICEYLIERSVNKDLLENKWQNLRHQALADGIMDAGVLMRYETHFRPLHLQCKDWLKRQLNAINQSLDLLNQDKLNDRSNLGNISIATALSYLELRKICNWRENCPQLSNWYDTISNHPVLVQSKPTDCPLPEKLIELRE